MISRTFRWRLDTLHAGLPIVPIVPILGLDTETRLGAFFGITDPAVYFTFLLTIFLCAHKFGSKLGLVFHTILAFLGPVLCLELVLL